MSLHQPPAENDFQFKLGLHLARKSVKRFFATGTIEHEPDLTPVAPETVEQEKNNTVQNNTNEPHQHKGITLMECLASVFVIGIGLLGVLAVIPYGSFQIHKADIAENTAWMLDSATGDLQAIEGLAKINKWCNGDNVIVAGTSLFDNDSTSTPDDDKLDCSKFIMVDPVGNVETIGGSIYRVGQNFTCAQQNTLQEQMTGQNDLVYTRYPDKRPDFSGQNNRKKSSGKYTWFFTFKPDYTDTVPPHPPGNVPWGDVKDTATVDIIGCYNRVPGVEENVPCTFVQKLLNGLMVKLSGLPTEVELKYVKYAFLSWDDTSTVPSTVEGFWYEVVNILDTASSTPTLVLFNKKAPEFPDSDYNNLNILFIEGTVYHKRIPDVSIKKLD